MSFKSILLTFYFCSNLLSCYSSALAIQSQNVISNKTSVKSYGAKGDGKTDDTNAFQKALDAYKAGLIDEIQIESGKYRITRTLTFTTKGYTRGLKLIGSGESSLIMFDFSTGEPLINIDGSSKQPYQFQRGGIIENFAIKGSSTKNGNQGAAIQICGWWMYEIKHLVIREVDGDGIKFPLLNKIDKVPDAYASVLGNISQCEISFCSGWGINAECGIGFGSNRISQCRIGENKEGGIKIGGHFNIINNCSIFSNGHNSKESSGGILIERVQSNPNNIEVINNELDNNKAYHIKIIGLSGGEISGNRCNSWNSVFKDFTISPKTHILLNPETDRSAITNVTFEKNYHRSQHKATGARASYEVVLYEFSNDPNITSIKIDNPIIPKEDNTPNITFFKNINPNSAVEIIKDNKNIKPKNSSAKCAIRLNRKHIIEKKASVVPFNSVWIDNLMSYDSKENKFVVPYSGLYNVNIGLTFEKTPKESEIRIYIKGKITYKMFYYKLNNGISTSSNSCTIYLTKGEKIWLEAESTMGAVSLKSGNIHNWLDIFALN